MGGLIDSLSWGEYYTSTKISYVELKIWSVLPQNVILKICNLWNLLRTSQIIEYISDSRRVYIFWSYCSNINIIDVTAQNWLMFYIKVFVKWSMRVWPPGDSAAGHAAWGGVWVRPTGGHRRPWRGHADAQLPHLHLAAAPQHRQRLGQLRPADWPTGWVCAAQVRYTVRKSLLWNVRISMEICGKCESVLLLKVSEMALFNFMLQKQKICPGPDIFCIFWYFLLDWEIYESNSIYSKLSLSCQYSDTLNKTVCLAS